MNIVLDEQAMSSCLGITEKQFRLLESDRTLSLRSMLKTFAHMFFGAKLRPSLFLGKIALTYSKCFSVNI